MIIRSNVASWFLFIAHVWKNTFNTLASVLKLVVGWAFMMLAFSVHVFILLALLPSQTARIKACNYFGTVLGSFFVWLSGCPFSVSGKENLDGDRPAIYVANHTSILDIFIGIWQSPTGTCGVAKKSVIYYPFFGLLYLLSGHLRIDRGNTKSAIKSMEKMCGIVKKNKLSLFIWPEGTRSRSGRLMHFKKGVVHLALQTGLPVVPFVIQGAHKSWEPKKHTIRKHPIHLEVLPAMDTSHWKRDDIQGALDEMEQVFTDALPMDQKPKRTFNA